MKRFFYLAIPVCLCTGLAVVVWAGTEETSGKEMKQVAPAPPVCNWTGFYIGAHVGGQFGHTGDEDLNHYQFMAVGPEARPWGYSQSGVITGGQIGYNFQWNCLVTGPEFDFGYMNMDGSGTHPESAKFDGGDTVGHSSSDFYMTFRGRIGIALNQWLFYATGGGIAVNWDTSVRDNCDTGPCGFDLIDAHKQELAWGWTVGSGVERMIGCHWSVKAEYLFFDLGHQDFSGVDAEFGDSFRFRADMEQGHIVRAGLNYKF